MLIQVPEMMADFKITRESSNIEEVYDALKRLRPGKLNTTRLIQLVRHVQSSKSASVLYQIKSKHYNIFGTGGDETKTINFSTIVSIIASNYVPVWKVGTRAVTAQWGSFEFIEFIKKVQSAPQEYPMYPIALVEKTRYAQGSGFISLQDLGFNYSNVLKKARKNLYDDGILDIYKIIFPIANLTDSNGQINGICSLAYLGYYIDVCRILKRNSLVVHSYKNIDELIAGNNLAVRLLAGQLTDIAEVEVPNIFLSQEKKAQYDGFIAEANAVETHFGKFTEILAGQCSNEILWTVAYNVASILNLDQEFLTSRKLEYKKISLAPVAAMIFQHMKQTEGG